MEAETPDIKSTWRADLQKIRAKAPAVSSAFFAFHGALMKKGDLTLREKELIALAIGVATGCDQCIHLHADEATKAGATHSQIIEAAGVAVLMQGGPAYMH